MFKLIKINNSTSNVPEIVKLKKYATLDFQIGEALSISNERAARCSENVRPDYIAVSYAAERDIYVYAYKVTCDMVFEADYYSSQALKKGEKHSLGTYDSDAILGIGMSDDNGVATVIDVVDSKKATIIFE